MRQIVRPDLDLPTLADPDSLKGDKWNEPDVRGALYAMHGFACAYCEDQLKEGLRGDVEHFRPKEHYKWLTYAFENYFLTCIVCNRELKRSNFPVKSKRVTYKTRAKLPSESRLLLDPEVDPTETWVRYDVFADDCPAIPHPGIIPVGEERVNATIKLLLLNHRRAVTSGRLETVDKVLGLLYRPKDPPAQVERALKKAASRHEPYNSIARTLIVAAKAKHLLPSPEEELELLIARLCLEFKVLLAMNPATAPRHARKPMQRQRDELLWALAVLWHKPPAASRAQVKGWLGPLADMIDQYRALLD